MTVAHLLRGSHNRAGGSRNGPWSPSSAPAEPSPDVASVRKGHPSMRDERSDEITVVAEVAKQR